MLLVPLQAYASASITWTGTHVFTAGSLGIGGTPRLGALDIQGTFLTLRDGTYQAFIGKGSSLHVGAATSDTSFRYDNADLIFSASGTTESLRLTSTGKTKVGSGVSADGGGMKHARVTTGSVASSAAPLITITWTTPFADANYTVVASVLDSSATSLALRVAHVETITAEAVTVRLKNDGAGALTGTVHVIAIHD